MCKLELSPTFTNIATKPNFTLCFCKAQNKHMSMYHSFFSISGNFAHVELFLPLSNFKQFSKFKIDQKNSNFESNMCCKSKQRKTKPDEVVITVYADCSSTEVCILLL